MGSLSSQLQYVIMLITVIPHSQPIIMIKPALILPDLSEQQAEGCLCWLL